MNPAAPVTRSRIHALYWHFERASSIWPLWPWIASERSRCSIASSHLPCSASARPRSYWAYASYSRPDPLSAATARRATASASCQRRCLSKPVAWSVSCTPFTPLADGGGGGGGAAGGGTGSGGVGGGVPGRTTVCGGGRSA